MDKRRYKSDYPIGTFPILDRMNERVWYSHKHGKIVFDIIFHPGSGGTYLYIEINEGDKPEFKSIDIDNEFYGKIDRYGDEYFIESIDNPNPSMAIRRFQRDKKLERILGTF